jgi:hypothetical protein
VKDKPAEFHPALAHRPLPIDSTIGSPSIRHSIATSCSWYVRGMSLL